MKSEKTELYDTYKLFLLLFTVIMPLTAVLCLLLAVLVFCITPSIWWVGLLFLVFCIAVLCLYWVIRSYIKGCMKQELANAYEKALLAEEPDGEAEAEKAEAPQEDTPEA